MMNPFVAELKQTLITETDFGVIHSQFLTLSQKNQGGFTGQMRSAEPNKKIMEMIGIGMAQIFGGKSVTLDAVVMMSNARDHMVHGGAFYKGHIMNFFYFSDIDKGMAAITPLQGGMTNFMRITAQILDKKIDVNDLEKN